MDVVDTNTSPLVDLNAVSMPGRNASDTAKLQAAQRIMWFLRGTNAAGHHPHHQVLTFDEIEELLLLEGSVTGWRMSDSLEQFIQTQELKLNQIHHDEAVS